MNNRTNTSLDRAFNNLKPVEWEKHEGEADKTDPTERYLRRNGHRFYRKKLRKR